MVFNPSSNQKFYNPPSQNTTNGQKRIQSTSKKTWKFIWEDDSAASWIVNIVLAFILIKFVVYPTLGFVFGTSFPIVAVVSGSMEHDGSFDDWWNSRAKCAEKLCTQKEYYAEYSISKDEFKSYRFKNGFNRGDIMVLWSPKDLKEGDVLVFQSARADPIIHRIVKVNDDETYQTKGDHNLQSIQTRDLNEVNIQKNQLLGKAVLRVPVLGYIKIWFVELIVQPYCTYVGLFACG